jgi:hypothetical protein
MPGSTDGVLAATATVAGEVVDGVGLADADGAAVGAGVGTVVAGVDVAVAPVDGVGTGVAGVTTGATSGGTVPDWSDTATAARDV